MPLPPAKLIEKTSNTQSTWRAYADTPTFERFLEFALALNNLSDYLFAKGLSGLHQHSRDLEQLTLSQLGDENAHPIAPAQRATLSLRLSDFMERIDTYVERCNQPVPERRMHTAVALESEQFPARLVWFIGIPGTNNRHLMAQLGYFHIQLEAYGWDNIPESAQIAPTILLDVTGLAEADWQQRISHLRQRYVASNLLALSMPADFLTLHAALTAGCDLCFPSETPLPAIVAKILELNDREEEEPYRVLVVEDSTTAIKVIQRTLKESRIQSEAITQPHKVLDAIARYQPDLILLDMHMPQCNGVETARVIRQQNRFFSIPIVYLSSETDVGMQIEALRIGGDHFITKPFNPVWLSAIVNSKIERYRAIRRSMQQDSLTGLLNHTSSKVALDQALEQSAALGHSMSVGMVDIDHFKRVNDQYGHPVGDQIIRSLAWLLKQRLRKGDIVGRYGGEEFIVGLPHTGQHEAVQIVDRIRLDFSQIRHPFEESWFNTTFSSGIASYPAILSVESLIKSADEALYHAKRQGRNQVVASTSTNMPKATP